MSDIQSSRRSRFHLKSFLNRSKSPHRPADDIDNDSTKPAPRRGVGVRRLSLKRKDKDMPAAPAPAVASGTKPASRIPSRPISSTTARTSTTIKPPNDSSLGKTSNVSKGSGTKQKLQNLFNGLARRSSRSRSRSRPNSPEPSSNVPPLPLDKQDHPPKLFSSARQSLDLTQTPSSIRKPQAVRRILKPEAPPDPLPAKHPPQPPGSASAQQPLLPPKKATNVQSLPTIRSKGLHVPKFASMDASYRFHGRKMTVVDEEGRGSTVDLEKSQTSTTRSETRSKMTTATRDTRHGSFDFERPGWGNAVLQRTGSNGTNSTHTSRATESTAQQQQQPRESSVFGAGLAGVGTLQRDKSIKRHKDTEEQIKARQRAERLHEYIQREKPPPIPTANGHGNGTGSSSNHSDNLNASTSTNGTAHKPSSLGKTGGKRVTVNGSRMGVGLTRLMGTPQHSLFPFEPPVPSPTWSTASNGTAVEASRKVEKKGSSKLSEEVGSDRKKGPSIPPPPTKKPAAKGDRAAIPVPVMNGHRPGNRGRSLDLGLGLSWAPSQIKETALMPSSTLFARTASSSSGPRSASGSAVGRTASNSTNGNDLNGRARRVHPIADAEPVVVAVEGERTKMGREVADLFRNVLDDRGYNAFKSYVRRFDAQDIPFDGRNGIVERVERLLRDSTTNIPLQERRAIMEKFIRIILQNA